jgi:hypothetical protein
MRSSRSNAACSSEVMRVAIGRIVADTASPASATRGGYALFAAIVASGRLAGSVLYKRLC